MLFRLLSLVHVCVAFPLKCPEPAQWSIRARSHCQNPSKYFCLKNDLINGFSENCTIFDFLQPGRKHVLRGGLDADICSSERFQPWPITFYTNVSTNCIFLKSKCNEEGQVLYGNGNRNTDATCRCDYTRGYDFLKKPRNPCFCIPSEEDCSCYLKKCPDSPFKLAPVYFMDQPSDVEPLEGQSVHLKYKLLCYRFPMVFLKNDAVITKTSHIKEKRKGRSMVLHIDPVTANDEGEYCLKVACFKSDMTRMTIKPLFKRPLENISILEGSETIFECQTEEENSPIEWFHEGKIVTNNSQNVKMENLPGYIYKLTISQTGRSDGGKYHIKKNGVDCKANLVVKALFKRPLENISILEGSDTIFECQTEEENSPIEWFHEGKPVTNNSQNVKMEKLPGYIYKLTISQTGRSDGGKYHIKKNGVDSQAILVVKALFRRPLENVSILEGSETIFECQTEEENSPVEWFHEGNKVTNETHNIKMETLPG
ncbi:titin [Mytilus galloprovincialis]|uniref:Titin n=1 Tax=Mytilus galloprovincialis TaxID=29158 RepID=A0A8B6GRH5_MYTGA|nr:titin [Mytilus galloprovincialis]